MDATGVSGWAYFLAGVVCTLGVQALALAVGYARGWHHFTIVLRDQQPRDRPDGSAVV